MNEDAERHRLSLFGRFFSFFGFFLGCFFDGRLFYGFGFLITATGDKH